MILATLIFLLGIFTGWLLKEQIGGRIAKRREAKPSADGSYSWIRHMGTDHAFTAEAMAVARDRAQKIIGEVDLE